MDFLLAALDEIAAEVFASVAHLLNLDLDIVFVDTTSTYWEVEGADQLADLDDNVDDDGVSRPVEQAKRTFGHSKDFRTDLPQVVIAMAVTRDGTPIRCWTFPGNENDTSIIRTVKDGRSRQLSPSLRGRPCQRRLRTDPLLPCRARSLSPGPCRYPNRPTMSPRSGSR